MVAKIPTLPLNIFTNWLAFGERGLSSEAIVSHLTGTSVGRYDHTAHPHDPDDYRRCARLLRDVPLAALAFPSMATCSPQWARLVEAWDEIGATCEQEAPGYLDKRSGSAPRAYRMMRRVIEDGTPCHDCDGTGNAEPCPKCKGSGRRTGGTCRYVGCHRGHMQCASCGGAGYRRKATA